MAIPNAPVGGSKGLVGLGRTITMNQEYTGTDNNIEKGCTGTDRIPNLWKVTDILIDGGYFIFILGVLELLLRS